MYGLGAPEFILLVVAAFLMVLAVRLPRLLRDVERENKTIKTNAKQRAMF